MNAENLQRAYERDGYVVVRGAVDESRLAALRGLIERHVDVLAAELLARGRIVDARAEEPFERRLAAMVQGTPVDMRKWNDFLFAREVYDVVTAPSLVRALTALLGAEVQFHGDYQLTPKLPGSTLTAFPWHQDTLYYGEASRHMHIVTAWLALVRADEENGCLRVMPGSHHWGLLPGARNADMNIHPFEDVERRGSPLAIPAMPGDVVLLGNLTFHASGVNRTQGVRWSMDLGFSAAADPSPPPSDERASRAFVQQSLRRMGRTPLYVASADPRKVQSWEDWQRDHFRS